MTELSYGICVVHYGDSALTRACLASTLAVDVHPVSRCIVDNSGSGSPLELPSELESEVIIVRPTENLGYAGGVNLGLHVLTRETRPDAMLVLNNDAQLHADAPTRLLDTLSRNPSIAMVGPRLLAAADGKIWHDGGRIGWPNASIHSVRFGEPEPEQALAAYDTEFVCGCAPMIRRTAFESVGGFDERYFLYYEDVDLSLRLLHRGWRLLHEPEARVDHVGSATTGAGSETARYYQLRNRLLFHSLHAPRTPESERAREGLIRESRRKMWRCLGTGRFDTARALRAALRDARAGHWGPRG